MVEARGGDLGLQKIAPPNDFAVEVEHLLRQEGF